MKPEFPNFQPLDLSSHSIILDFTSKFDPYSDFNFTSLYSWDINNTASFAFLNNNIVISFKDYDGTKDILSILGTTLIDKSLKTLLNYAKTQEYISNELKFVPEIVIKEISDYLAFEIKEDADNHDYILSTEEAVNLTGSKYANKRKNINRLLNNFGHQLLITDLNLKDVNIIKQIEEINLHWFNQDGSSKDDDADDQLAIKKLLENYNSISQKLKFYTLGVQINGRLESYCIFEQLSSDWAISHFGKATRNYKSTYEYMMVEILRALNMRKIKYLNYEQDLGIPSLRESKLSSKPVKFLKKYCVSSR